MVELSEVHVREMSGERLSIEQGNNLGATPADKALFETFKDAFKKSRCTF